AHLKMRRLERCRLDLGNAAMAHFSVSALCFRWGFNDAANFSRAFSARFGVSPRAYRAAPGKNAEAALRRGRPERASAGRPMPLVTEVAGRQQFRELLGDHARYARALALAPKRATRADPKRPGDAQASGPYAHYYIPASDKTVHWGYFSRDLKPVLT